METLDRKNEETELLKQFSEKCTTAVGEQQKKTEESGAINAYYIQALKKYPVSLRNTNAKGRHAVASNSIAKGTTVCLEEATAFVVRSEYIDQQCHVCLDAIPPTRKLMCSDCKKTMYCSESCVAKDDVHLLACSSLAQVDAIGRSTDVDVDLLRLIILLLARCQLNNEEDPSTHANATPFWCVSDLISHREQANPEFIQVVTEAAHRLISEMPPSMQVSADEIVTLACRINSNAHGLGDNQARNTDVALGLFPVGALFFNHACNPNSAFIGFENGKLAFRTIRPVAQGEELTVSYIDIYASRDERRQELYFTKHFWCECERCMSSNNTSVDRYLEGVVCTQCAQDVYVVPQSSLQDISQLRRKIDSDVETSWECASCHHTMEAKGVRDKLSQAQKTYDAGITAMRQRKNQVARDMLQPLAKAELNPVAGELHPLHALRLNASIPLMNCLRRDRNLKGAADINRIILDLLSLYSKHGLPQYTAEASDFWQNLGELCNEIATEYRTSGRAPFERKWRKSAKEAYTSSVEYRTVVYGKDHVKTKEVAKSIRQ